MRLGDGGFISTVDTIVAMEALVHYSYNSRIKDITDLYVEIDIPDSNMTHTIPITGENIARMQRIDIPNVWGHLNIVANGAGKTEILTKKLKLQPWFIPLSTRAASFGAAESSSNIQ